MIGIEEIGYYLPDRRINNLERLEALNTDEDFIRHKTGMVRLALKSNDEDTSDLCCAAFRDLQKKSQINLEEIDCVVVCTQNPDGSGLPHTSAIVHAKLGLSSHCAAFDISLGCSGYVYGLSIIQSFMQANDLKKGLLFTADPYSKVIDNNDKNTSMLFGDGATVTLISDTPNWTSSKFLLGTYGLESQALKIDESTNLLNMNGRAVFSFSATRVPENIEQMLLMNGVAKEDVDCFALHQGSKYIVDTIQKRLGVPEDKVPFVASDYGNTVSSSIPMILKDLDDTMKRVVIAGFGVGLSWASTVLVKQG